MTIEILWNITHVIFGIWGNNILSTIIAINFLLYNIHNKTKKKKGFNMIIDNMEENKSFIEKVSFEYKIKFVFYMIVTIYCVWLGLLSPFDWDDSFYDMVRIYNDDF